MNIEAVIFDLGGTLIEYTGGYSSWPDLETPGFFASFEYLERQTVPLPSFDRFRMVGFDILPMRWRQATSGQRNLTVSSLLTDILANFNITAPARPILAAASRKYEAAVCADARPIPYGHFVVSQLKAKGYKLGLVSNTMFSGEIHRVDLARFDLDSFFDSMLFSADANKWKPSVEPFHAVLDQLDVKPVASVFVGDDPAADVIGAKRAGMVSIHLRSSQRFPSPDGVTPDFTIVALSELPSAIDRINL
jgi:putative hydrolase of the HAD superfamily